jgi:hypothetical protein
VVVADEPAPTADVFMDERGSMLRARWDDGAQQLSVSIWREGRCVATHHLGLIDTARLSSLLTQAWVEGLRHSADAT